MRYLLYARKSSETEDRQVQSIDDQLRVLRDLAQQRGLGVVREMVESKSAKAPGARPVFAEMLALVQAGQADALLCWSLNRLSRNPVDTGTLSWLLQEGKLQRIQTAEREYTPDDNVVLMAVEGGVANQFIRDLKKAVERGMQSKREKGWYPHRAPEGYVNDRVERTIVADPEAFALLRRAWELMLTGAYTVPQVRQELTGWGFRARKTRRGGGGPISRTALYDLFDNPFYYGSFRHDGRLYRGAHTPMVTEAEWDRVQALLHRDHHSQPQRREFPFAGLIRCGVCGCLVSAEEKVKRYPTTGHSVSYRYYHCSGAKGCPKVSVTEAEIDGRVRALLEECSLPPWLSSWLLGAAERGLAAQDGPDAALAAQGKALAALRRRRAGLVDMRAAGEVTAEEFAQGKARLDAEVADLEGAARRQEGRRDRDRRSLRNALRFAGSACEHYANGDVRARREVASVLGENWLLTLGELSLEPHPLLDRIRTFEPIETGSGNTKKDHPEGVGPAWCPMLDDMLSFLDKSDVSFEGLPSSASAAGGSRTSSGRRSLVSGGPGLTPPPRSVPGPGVPGTDP